MINTAIENHIEHLHVFREYVDKNADEKEIKEAMFAAIDAALENSNHFLKLEKEQIEKAFNDGLNCNVSGATGKEYFINNYKK